MRLLNTAIEDATNRIPTQEHPLVKKAKNAGGAAGSVAMLMAGVVLALP